MAADDAEMLLDCLGGRDAPCPRCGYNLRDLTAPVCPECREELSLTVGFRQPRIVWFLVTVTPGLFSGISSFFLLIPMIGQYFQGNPPAPWPILSCEAFGMLSGITALVLVKCRYAFLRQSQARQRTWAVVAWGVHVGTFALLMISLILLNL